MGQCSGECTKKSWGLDHDEPRLFVTSQWPCHGVVYPIYRSVVALYFLCWLVVSGAWSSRYSTRPENDIKWFIYLTNWNILWLTVSLLTRMALSIWAYLQLRQQARDGTPVLTNMTWYLKMSWVFYNTSSTLTMVVSIVYYALIWQSAWGLEILDFHTHALNSICIIVDVFITALPLRLLHYFHGVLTATLFIVFSIIYDLSGGTNSYDLPYIYSIIDWNDEPGWAIAYSLLTILVFSPGTWLVVCGCYHLRIFIYTRCSAAWDDDSNRPTSKIGAMSWGDQPERPRSKTGGMTRLGAHNLAFTVPADRASQRVVPVYEDDSSTYVRHWRV